MSPRIFNLPAQAGTNLHKYILITLLFFGLCIFFVTPVRAEDFTATNNNEQPTTNTTTVILDTTSSTIPEMTSATTTVDVPTTTIDSPSTTIDTPAPTSTTSTPTITIEGGVDVSTSCEVTDSDGVSHIYDGTASSTYLAICAIQSALESSVISSVKLSNQYPSMGLFVTGINNTEADPLSQYWALFQNDAYTASGLTLLPVMASDTIKLELQDFSGNNLGSSLTLHINSLLTVSSTSSTNLNPPTPVADPSSGDATGQAPPNSNQLISQSNINDTVNKILNYLKTQQSADGKIIDGTITDWAIMSFGSDGQYADEIKHSTTSLLSYEKQYNLDDPSDMNSCATYPRHILALIAAGVDKNDSAIIGLKNKVETICFQNNSYGLNGINDDVFALLSLLAIEEDINKPIIQSTIDTIKAWQMDNGAFSWPDWFNPSAKVAGDDITGAAINALKYAQAKGATVDNQILDKAKTYLKNTQQLDGGWGYGSADIMTTSWVLMGLNALGETQENWFTASNTNPWYPLVNQIKTNGYYESAWVPGTVDWFAMKHAVPALLEKSWPIILPAKVQNFSSGASFTYGSGGAPLEQPITGPTTTPTTTLDLTTTTLDVATTTATSTIDEQLATSTTPTTKISDFSLPAQAGLQNAESTTTPSITYHVPRITYQNNKTIEQFNNDQLAINHVKSPVGDHVADNDDILSPATSTTPYQQTARGVFATATTLASGLGLFLVWRLAQTLL